MDDEGQEHQDRALHDLESADQPQRRVGAERGVLCLRDGQNNPASITTVWPVTLSARQNVTTWFAMSPASAERCSAASRRARSTTSGGIRAAIRVPSTRPGATQFTVIVGASATARQRVRWISAALLDAYAIELPIGFTPATDAMLTMRP